VIDPSDLPAEARLAIADEEQVNPNLALQKATKRCRISGKQGNAQVKRKTAIRTNQNNDPLGDSVREPNGEIRLKNGS